MDRSRPPIRVVIADDHAVFRLGMRRLLDSVPGIELVGEASDTDAAIAATLELNPDVAVLDLDMPGGGGVVATRRILDQAPSVRILILTMHADGALLARALGAGALGYVVKDSPAEDIERAIHAVNADQAILDPAVASALVLTANSLLRRPFPQLTDRELAVLEAIAAGASNQAIAVRMGISVKTVQNHVSNVLLKLGVPDRSTAAARLRELNREGLPRPPAKG